ncbi:hypothetical protein DSO57_1010355 [Entomophthora muscae]|uniref:Uncharacterized protein n=1 Tax=Entomophthora muscae TaxID=34485 RepID=A0ACC2UG08_9FUNG|nr:hypothetical protein DSO57_1010355 [Entomophthora muscae]
MAVLSKYYQALFPFLSSMDVEKVAAWRHFDCLITTDRSIVGKVILGPSHLMFVGKRLATSLSKLKHTYTFFSKYEEMHDIRRDNNGFFYRSNIVLLIGQDQLVTLSFRRNRDAVFEELILRCSSSKPVLRSIFNNPSPRPRTFTLPTLRGQSLDCLPTAKKGFNDNHKSLIMDFFPTSDTRKSLQKDERRAKRQSFLITRAQSFEPPEARPKEKERRKTFFLERRSSPHFFRSKSNLALATGEEEPILFDGILPIASQKLLALLFPDTRPDLKQRSLILARDLPRRSLSIKKLLPRSKGESAASSMHLFALRVLGPEGPIYFSCREERDIQNDITIQVETQNTLMSRMRPFSSWGPFHHQPPPQ